VSVARKIDSDLRPHMTGPEVAARLGCSNSWVLVLVAKGVLTPALTLQGQRTYRVFLRTDIEAYANARKENPPRAGRPVGAKDSVPRRLASSPRAAMRADRSRPTTKG